MKTHPHSNIKALFQRDVSASIQRLIKNSSSSSNMMSLNRIPNQFNMKIFKKKEKKALSQCYDDSVIEKQNNKVISLGSGLNFGLIQKGNSQLLLPLIKKTKINHFLKKKKNCFLQDNNSSYRSSINKKDNTSYLFNNKTNIIISLNNQDCKENIVPQTIPLTCNSTNRTTDLQAFLNLNDNNSNNKPKLGQKNSFLKKVYSSTFIMNVNKAKDTKQHQGIEMMIQSHEEKDKLMQLANNDNEKDKENKDNALSPEPALKTNSVLKTYKGKSQAGQTEHQQRKINQDSYLIMTNVNKINDYNLFCVFDGHGLNGHLVSEFVKHYLRTIIETHEDIKDLTTIDKVYLKLKENDYYFIKQSFKTAEEQLSYKDFDVNFSGTTGVVVFQLGSKIICANVGDSRAILIGNNDSSAISNSNNQILKLTPLSYDHKPHLIKEKKRIVKLGGKVEKFSGKTH